MNCDCGETFTSEDEAYAHTRKFGHCVTDAAGNEVFCHRWDH